MPIVSAMSSFAQSSIFLESGSVVLRHPATPAVSQTDLQTRCPVRSVLVRRRTDRDGRPSPPLSACSCSISLILNATHPSVAAVHSAKKTLELWLLAGLARFLFYGNAGGANCFAVTRTKDEGRNHEACLLLCRCRCFECVW